MINLTERIQQALKEHNTVALIAYRNLKSEEQKYLSSKKSPVFNENVQLEIFNKYAKLLTDAVAKFKASNREDLAAGYEAELEEINKLLPAPITPEDIYGFMDQDPYFIDMMDEHRCPRIPKSGMGAAIKYIKSIFPTADGKMISDIVKEYIV